MKTILGKDLKVGDQIQTWFNEFVQVQRLGDHRTQVLNGVEHKLFTAFCLNGYNITVFADKKDVRIAK